MTTKLFIVLFGFVLVACGDDSSTTTNNANNSPFDPAPAATLPDGGTPGSSSGNPATTGDGGVCGQPAGCYCGTPTTQQQFLNRCTTAAALPVTLTVKPATTANVP